MLSDQSATTRLSCFQQLADEAVGNTLPSENPLSLHGGYPSREMDCQELPSTSSRGSFNLVGLELGAVA
jgi:hypothetical protein